ncbi:MAG: hypothetical protein M3Z06_13970 [Actinomycetota bacterium]|nr:hypothetical protein [Actinomycetota bacterium]
MSLPERDGLIARLKQTRRLATPSGPAPAPEADPVRFRALETRISHLEALLEGLQDSVHRESARQSRRIAELEARTEPAALAIALSRNARDRGL